MGKIWEIGIFWERGGKGDEANLWEMRGIGGRVGVWNFDISGTDRQQLIIIIICSHSNQTKGMNQFISPHQNININISYNLAGQEKIPKVVFGKKLTKVVKSSKEDQDPKPFYKTFKKSEDPPQSVEEPKKTKSQKKGKTKKKSQAMLTLPDQDELQHRRFKTEGNAKTDVLGTLLKKEKANAKSSSKPTNHFKSMNNPQTSSISKQKKPSNPIPLPPRPKKEDRRHSNKSCILSQPKKILLSDIQHIISTTTSGPTINHRQTTNQLLHPSSINPLYPSNSNTTNNNNNNPVTKKRVYSANVIRNDRFINRLLDMSVLTSELGASIPMNQDKCKGGAAGEVGVGADLGAKTALQAFMSSIDMRMIKKMEQDNCTKKAILADFGRSDGLELITFLNRIRRIPMEKLNEKAGIIQKYWRKKSRIFIVPYYRKMFFRNPAINTRLAIQRNIEQISVIENVNQNNEQSLDQHNYSNPCQQKNQQQQESSSSCYNNWKQNDNHNHNHNNKPILQFISAAKVSEISKSELQESINTDKINRIIYEPQEFSTCNQGDFQVREFQLTGDKIGRGTAEDKDKEKEEEEEGSSNNKINIQKYKQLVKKEIQSKQVTNQPKVGKNFIVRENQRQQVHEQNQNEKQEMKAQSVHWNHVHNILSTNMNKKVPVMSKTVLQQLMRQSAYNKQWVEGQFSKDSIHAQDKEQTHQYNEQYQNQRNDNVQEYNFSEQSQGQSQSSSGNVPEVQYNWNKYSDISKIKKPQELVHKPKNKADDEKNNQLPIELEDLKKEEDISIKNSENLQDYLGLDKIPGLLPSGVSNKIQSVSDYEAEDHHDIQMSEDRNYERDEKWVREQMIMEDVIVANYLDCGLDYFGLNLNSPAQVQRGLPETNEHEPVLQKDHRPQKKTHDHPEPKPTQPSHETVISKQDDIFSNGAHPHHQDDMELVYVFQNIDGRRGREDDKNLKKNVHEYGFNEVHSEEHKQQSNVDQSLGLFQPSFGQPPEIAYTREELQIREEVNTKRKEKITEAILTRLIEEFAYDVSIILRKSHNQSGSVNNFGQRNNQAPPPQIAQPPVINPMGIQTSFQSIQEFIQKLKQFLLGDQISCRKIIENLKYNIGPTSMEILTYLRSDERNQFDEEVEQEEQENQEFLFVIPNQLFQTFNRKLLDQEEQLRRKKLTNKFKLYTQFWNRSIFECYNECLDYERPYGITGAPYSWICEPKLPKKVEYSKQKVIEILNSAENRLLEIGCTSSGIIFDKPQSRYQELDLNQEQRTLMNEQKISRMLATEILDDEYNWITYNDEITELLVDITRKIEEILIFQVSSDLKKIIRRRKLMVCVGGRGENDGSDSADDQHAVFMVEDLI